MSAAPHNHPLAGALGQAVILRLVGAALGFVTTVALARVLGADGFGIYAYALTLVTVLAVPAQFGVPALVVREATQARSGGQRSVYGAVITLGLIAIFAYFAIILAPLLQGIVYALPAHLPISSGGAWAALGVALALALLATLSAMFRAVGSPTTAQLGPEALRPIALLAALAGLTAAGCSLTGTGALLTHAVAAAAVCGVMGWVFYRHHPEAFRFKTPPPAALRHWHSTVWYLGLSAGIYGLVQSLDFLMLGWFEPMETVGAYRVAVQLVFFTALGLKAVEVVLAAPIARLARDQHWQELDQLAALSPIIAAGLALPVVTALVIAGDHFLLMAFGADYISAWAPLAVLATGKLVYLALAPAGLFLNMGGHAGWPLWTGGAALFLNGLLNLLLIPPFGAIGAALATTTAFAAWGCLLWFGARIRLNVTVNPFRLYGLRGAVNGLRMSGMGASKP